MAKMIRRDDSFEFQFVMDYAEFGLRINFEAAAALYEKASMFMEGIVNPLR